MIIARAPLRVSFCGGGSDIPAFYKEYGGCVLSCSLRKYVYIAIHPSFYKQTITLKYSQTEEVNHYDEIQHKYFRIMLIIIAYLKLQHLGLVVLKLATISLLLMMALSA